MDGHTVRGYELGGGAGTITAGEVTSGPLRLGSGSGHTTKLTREQVEALATEISAGDMLRARRLAGDDGDMLTAHAIASAAYRIGLATNTGDPLAVMDLISAPQLTYIARRMSGEENPTTASTEASPPLPDTGG